MMPLTFLNPGEQNIIKRVGGTPEMKKHLADLGFVVGGNVSVINSVGGNIIVNVKETRVAISKEMAQKLWSNIFNNKYTFISKEEKYEHIASG